MFRLCVVAVALSLWFALIMTARPAHATSCDTITDDEAMNRADVAFTAVCVGVRKDAQRGLIATLDVQRVYKGIVPPKLELTTGGIKDASFRVHESYAVFMKEDVPDRANLCGGTRRIDEVPWPSSFGAGEPPDPSVSQIAARPKDDAPQPIEPLPSTAPQPHADAPPPFPEAAPMPAAPATLPAPAPATAPAGGGCAGCHVGAPPDRPDGHAVVWLAWLVLLSRWLYRRPRRCRA